jgi:CheY-like chemotaxis protein
MAQNGPEALTICKQHRSPIHLLLTDMIMPNGLNGSELARYLLAIHPALKVVYMSGYTDNALIERSLLASDAAFLQKPFTPDKLVGKLREVLDQA